MYHVFSGSTIVTRLHAGDSSTW